jgi:hypothetical protein
MDLEAKIAEEPHDAGQSVLFDEDERCQDGSSADLNFLTSRRYPALP